MKRIIISLIIVLLIGIIGCKKAEAIEMPDMSVGWTGLYSLDTEQVTSAQRVAVTLVTAFNGIVKGNIAAAFPNSDTIKTTFVGGPDITIDLFKLLSLTPKITVIKEFQLETGAGIMFDVFHVDGMELSDWKKITYPSVSVGFSF